MKNKLFGQNINTSCAYCENYVLENEITYCRKGKQIKNEKCRHFKYDPLMRIPKSSAVPQHYKPEDFKL